MYTQVCKGCWCVVGGGWDRCGRVESMVVGMDMVGGMAKIEMVKE